ncbi:hypothetical protein CsSME_00019008 [Camellia sinensis var. sinensis]
MGLWRYWRAICDGVDQRQMGLTRKADVLLYGNIVQQGIIAAHSNGHMKVYELLDPLELKT